MSEAADIEELGTQIIEVIDGQSTKVVLNALLGCVLLVISDNDSEETRRALAKQFAEEVVSGSAGETIQ